MAVLQTEPGTLELIITHGLCVRAGWLLSLSPRAWPELPGQRG